MSESVKHLVHVGGYGTNSQRARYCAEAFAERLDCDFVYPFTFGEAMSSKKAILYEVTEGAIVTGHSAGAVALLGTVDQAPLLFARAIMFSPCMPDKFRRLLWAGHLTNEVVRKTQTLTSYAQMLLDFGKELLTPTTEKALTNHIFQADGTIPNFDSISAGADHVREGASVDLVFGTDDKFYPPRGIDAEYAKTLGVGYHVIDMAHHNKILFNPSELMSKYLDQVPQ